LKIDNKHVKSLYRRARALAHLREFDKSMEAFKELKMDEEVTHIKS